MRRNSALNGQRVGSVVLKSLRATASETIVSTRGERIASMKFAIRSRVANSSISRKREETLR